MDILSLEHIEGDTIIFSSLTNIDELLAITGVYTYQLIRGALSIDDINEIIHYLETYNDYNIPYKSVTLSKKPFSRDYIKRLRKEFISYLKQEFDEEDIQDDYIIHYSHNKLGSYYILCIAEIP